MGNSSRPYRIALFGTFGAGNLGNECTLEAMFRNVRRYAPNAEIICICAGPEEIASRFGISTFPIRSTAVAKSSPGLPPVKRNSAVKLLHKIGRIPRELYRWHETITIMRSTDMLVMTGLGMLGDFGISPFGLHYDILRWSLMARLCRCKVLFVSVGVGPIGSSLSRYIVKAALAFGNYRSYRDEFSRRYLESIGFSTAGDSVYPDLAFSLPQAMLPRSQNRAGQRPVIGVGLMTYHGRRGKMVKDDAVYDNYTANAAGFVIKLLEHGYAVRLLIGDVVYDGDVRMAVRKIVEARGWPYDGKTIIDEPAESVSDILTQLAATDIVVASRFHNVLLALMLAKPVVAVSYHEKVSELVNGVGLAQFCQDIEHIDIERLIGQFTELQNDAQGWKQANGLEERTEAYRRALDEQYGRIFGTVAT